MSVAYDYQSDYVEQAQQARKKAEIRRRIRARQVKRRKLIVLGGILCLVLSLLFGYASGAVRIFQLRDQIADTQKEIMQVSEEIARLEQKKLAVESPEYVEKMAREKLGLVKPGEVKYIITEPVDEWREADVQTREKPYTEPLY